MGFFSWLKELLDPQPRFLLGSYNPPSYYHPKSNEDADVAPPAYTAPLVEPSGHTRITFQGTPGFPTEPVTGPPPFSDLDGISPVFFGSAHFNDTSIHPCKIVPALSPSPCRVPYGGKEYHHDGAYSLLPFNPETMELVPSTGGRIPKGRRPIVGGHEKNEKIKLYHAVANVPVRGGIVRVPGKTAPHLSGCNFAWGGTERVFQSNYEILCWRGNAKSDTLQKSSSDSDSWKR
ncbi:hypothetical protein J3R30DRAFT_3714146 [Lentinula aciculospora]|uniref:Uncharacterized protein n=1 Tax=Lentinula aciculospora TaxID=153920 RepID=A0A9W9DGS8_9AGAR|nr:hypothetical protein J3R30DRAFT_3714146 [Lentinula aciculospora]